MKGTDFGSILELPLAEEGDVDTCPCLRTTMALGIWAISCFPSHLPVTALDSCHGVCP